MPGVGGKPGFARTATRRTFGKASFRRSSRFPLSSGLMVVVPVTLPPGRVKRGTIPATMGSATAPKTTGIVFVARSEEHTSELQSRGHLVCRLLLEKKNNINAVQLPQ